MSDTRIPAGDQKGPIDNDPQREELANALWHLRERMNTSIRQHRTWHGWLYNGSTVLTLILTASASLASAGQAGFNKEWAPALAAFATVLIGVDRALGFGAKQRFHTEMKHGYLTVKDMLDFIPPQPISVREKWIQDAWARLHDLRSRKGQIVSAGGDGPPKKTAPND